MKYAHLEENTNKLLGWYDDSIHKTIPTPKRPINVTSVMQLLGVLRINMQGIIIISNTSTTINNNNNNK